MNANLIVVTGCFGAPVKEKTLELARQRGLPLVDLDNEITKRDGRSIRRLVMMNGEHGYRNAEYEILNELSEDGASIGKPLVEEWKCPYHNGRMCLRLMSADLPESL